MNINENLDISLSLLTYNSKSIDFVELKQPNIFIGVGFWSLKEGLSAGLPIDIMHMLLSAAIMKAQIEQTTKWKSSKVIILLADMMAVREGADSDKVTALIEIYKKSLEPLLNLLNIENQSEIILVSKVKTLPEFNALFREIEKTSTMQEFKETDKKHYVYLINQIAITHYMNKHKNVGIKIGWILETSKGNLNNCPLESLKSWDELRFDRWCEATLKSTIQYLYTKAGLKQEKCGKHVNVQEGCPYTAFPQDNRYLLQTEKIVDIKNILQIQNKVASQWKGIAQKCATLIEAKLFKSELLPNDCITKSNDKTTVYNLLNHWTNLPVLYHPNLTRSRKFEKPYTPLELQDEGYLRLQAEVSEGSKIRKHGIIL